MEKLNKIAICILVGVIAFGILNHYELSTGMEIVVYTVSLYLMIAITESVLICFPGGLGFICLGLCFFPIGFYYGKLRGLSAHEIIFLEKGQERFCLN